MSIEKQTVELLKSKKLKLATAESCTGGLISKRITDVSGSSAFRGCIDFRSAQRQGFVHADADDFLYRTHADAPAVSSVRARQ